MILLEPHVKAKRGNVTHIEVVFSQYVCPLKHMHAHTWTGSQEPGVYCVLGVDSNVEF